MTDKTTYEVAKEELDEEAFAAYMELDSFLEEAGQHHDPLALAEALHRHGDEYEQVELDLWEDTEADEAGTGPKSNADGLTNTGGTDDPSADTEPLQKAAV